MKADELITQRLAETSTLRTYAKKGAYKDIYRSKTPVTDTGKGTDRSQVMHPETGPDALNVYAKKGAYKYPGSGSRIKKESY
jgi:hypothetical protein